MNKEKFSADSFLVLPKSELSISYIAACYEANIRTQIGIVAAFNDTVVTITLPEVTKFKVAVEHNGKGSKTVGKMM